MIVAECEEIVDARIEPHRRQRTRITLQLLVDLLEVVQVDVGIPEGVYEAADLEAADLGDHHGEQGVGSDVERNPEEQVRTPLVELAGEPSLRHVELEEGVTR